VHLGCFGLLSYRENVKQLNKGDKSFLPEKKPAPSYMLVCI